MGQDHSVSAARQRLAHELRATREALGLSQRDVEERSGLAKSVVSNAENPNLSSSPSPDTLWTLTCTYIDGSHDVLVRQHLEWMELAGHLRGLPSGTFDARAAGIAERLAQLSPTTRATVEEIIEQALELGETATRVGRVGGALQQARDEGKRLGVSEDAPPDDAAGAHGASSSGTSSRRQAS